MPGNLEAGKAYVELVPRLSEGWGARVAGQMEAATTPVLTRIAERFSSIGDRLRGVGSRMSAFVTLPILAAGAASFKLASDLDESRNKVKVVFGDMSASVIAWAQNAAQSFGISRQEALEAVGTFGNLFAAMGIGIPTAADMSEKLVGLASDLASFNNADPSEVLEALRSGLVGEVEPLRRFGVNLNQARIEAKALELGIWDGITPLTAAQKAQAAYGIILDDTKNAQGDFARTSDGAANKQRILLATFKDLGAELGQKLLPIGQKILDFVGELFDGFSSLPGPVQDFGIYIGIAAAAAGPLVYIIGALSSVIGAILSPVVIIGAAIAALVAGAIALGVYWDEVWEFVANNPWVLAVLAPLGAILGPIIAVVGAIKLLADNWEEIWPAIVAAAEDALAWLEQNVGPVLDRIITLFSTFGEYALAVFGFVWETLKAGWDLFGEDILYALQTVWDTIVGIVEGALEVIGGILDIFIGIFTLDWSTAWEGIKSVFSGIWDAIGTIFQGALDSIGNAVDAFGQIIGPAFSAIWDGIKAAAGLALDALVFLFVTLPGRILGAIAGLAGQLWTFASSLPGKIWEGFNAAVGFLWSQLSGFVGTFTNKIGEVITAAFNVGVQILHALWNGIEDAAGWFWDQIAGFVSDLAEELNPFGSPKRFSYYIGQDIAADYSEGLASRAELPRPAAARMVANIRSTLELAPFRPAADFGTEERARPNNNVFYVRDERDIVEELYWLERTGGR